MQTDLSPITWRCCVFADLSLAQLQHIYAARQAVFIVEQQCCYLDADGQDEQAWHLAAWAAQEAQPLAYARLFAPGLVYPEASIGRVMTTRAVRGAGWGRQLVQRAIDECNALFSSAAIRISAQAHLTRFYESFGFQVVSDPYMEDGIAHLEMRRPNGPSSHPHLSNKRPYDQFGCDTKEDGHDP
jgi:ElaA protein